MDEVVKELFNRTRRKIIGDLHRGLEGVDVKKEKVLIDNKESKLSADQRRRVLVIWGLENDKESEE